MNNHIVINEHSLIVEAASALCSVMSINSRFSSGAESAISKLPTDLVDYLNKNEVVKYIKSEDSFNLIPYEMFPYISERHNIKSFVDEFSKIESESLQVMFLCAHYSHESIKVFIAEDMYQELYKSFNVHDKEAFKENLINPLPLFQEIVSLIVYIYNHQGFKSVFQADVKELLIEKHEHIETELKKRHPLSLAQSIMGKSFYNIADWSEYEFSYSYLTPLRYGRLMNSVRNVLIENPINPIMNEADSNTELKSFLKCLGDGTRLRIFRMIYSNAMSGKDIANNLSLTTATVSHHLDLMKKENLVHIERKKNVKLFSINKNTLNDKTRFLQKYITKNL